MQHVAAPQQLLKPHILCPARQLRAQRPPVVVLHAHAEGFRPLLHFPPDAPHAQDAEQFSLRVVPERCGGVPPPRLLPQRRQWRGEVAERAQQEEERRVRRRGVHRGRHVRDPDRAGRAGGDVDLVVAGA